jgi:hypothetical protein
VLHARHPTDAEKQGGQMTTVTVREEGPVARPLKVLVPLIQNDLEQAKEASQRASMPFVRAAGEKMLEAKPQMKNSEFGPWIKRNFKLSPAHAYRYMALVTTETSSRAREFSSMGEFMRETGRDPGYGRVVRKRDWHEDVKGNIERARREAERIREADLTRQQEREAEKKLALRLIDIGYKVLAKELHPDKGGDREAMARLGRIRDRLKQSV